jgi:DNA-binding CsgD family transcriptional regulator
MVGRAAELTVVRRLVDAAASGGGAVLLVTGEAGIGKSRLLGAATDLATKRGLTVLTGRAVEGAGTYRPIAHALVGHLRGSPPAEQEELRPYRAALRRLVPGMAEDWVEPERGGGDPLLVLGEGLVRLLGAIGAGVGCLLVLEDLHWADADTLALVDYLAGAVQDSSVLLVASARDDWPGAAAVDRLTLTPGVTTLRLGRLAEEDVLALAEAHAGGPVTEPFRRFLFDRSDGLPLLVDELLAGIPPARARGLVGGGEPPSASIPGTFAGLVARRLAFLDPDSRRALTAAAVLGTDPDWSLLPQVSGLTEAGVLRALRQAAAAHLLVADGRRLRWRHALTRDAVLATLLPPERAALARRAARVLRSRGRQDDERAAAELLIAAGESAEAADILLGLARRDLARGALRSAAELLDRAESAGAEPAAAAIARVHQLTLAGQAHTALEVGARALEGATGGDHTELALRLARAAIAAGRWTDTERYVQRAGRPADPRSAALLADAAHGAGRIGAAAAYAATAAEQAADGDRPDVQCEALVISGKVARLRDPAAAAAAFSRAAQVAAEHGLTPWRVEALLGLGTVELLEAERSASLPEARELALDAGLLAQAASADVILADCLLVVDGPRAVGAPGLHLVEQGRLLRLPTAQAAGEILLALNAAEAGDLQGMEARLADAAAHRDVGPEVAALAHAVRALPALFVHDLGRANVLLDTGMAPLLGHGSAAPLHQFGLWALLRTLVGDREEQAREALRGHAVAMRPANRGALHYADAVAAGRAGRLHDAVVMVTAGDADLAGLPWLRRLLRLLTLEAAVADGWGDPVPDLRAALSEHERADEPTLARTCRDLLRRAGAPTRRGRGDSAVPRELRAKGITSREMDVLTLVAEGRTNAAIAAQLYLSPRTVETHVANLLAKTGAANRTELRAWAWAQTP